MEEVKKKKDVYSVWALPDDETEPRFRKLMEALRSEFSGPRFDPHVTVVGATSLTAEEAKKMFESACDGLKAYTATVDRVSTGTFFYQCVFLLLKSTPEVNKNPSFFPFKDSIFSDESLQRDDLDHIKNVGFGFW